MYSRALPSYAALSRRDPRPPVLEITGLNQEERTAIVTAALAEYRKKLNAVQLAILMAKDESTLPLYLLTVCEELRLQARARARYVLPYARPIGRMHVRNLNPNRAGVTCVASIFCICMCIRMRGQLDLRMSECAAHWTYACSNAATQAQYGAGGSGVDTFLRGVPESIPELLDVVIFRVERDIAEWVKTSGKGAGLTEAIERLAEREREVAEQAAAAATAAAAAAVTPAVAAAGAVTPLAAPVPVAAAPAPTPVTAVTAVVVDDAAFADQCGRMLVQDALTLLEASRHGLREAELLELLAPPGKQTLPPVVWARLYRSLEQYLRPADDDEAGLLGYIHLQMIGAVRAPACPRALCVVCGCGCGCGCGRRGE